MKFISENNRSKAAGKLLLNISCFLSLFMYSPTQAKAFLNEEVPRVKKDVKLVGDFQHITIDGDFSIILTNEPAGTLSVEGNEKILKKVRYTIKNDTLSIDINQFLGGRKLTLYLSAIALQNMELNGNSDVSSSDILKSDDLHVMLNGDIKLRIKTAGKINFDYPETIDVVKRTRKIEKQSF